jgi:hypothetical protein
MSGSDRPVVALIYAAVIGLFVTSALVPFRWVMPGWREVGRGLVTGGASKVAQWLAVLAFQQARASVLAPFSYSQLLWSALLGYVVFGNVPDGWTVTGAVVIIERSLHRPSGENSPGSTDTFVVTWWKARDRAKVASTFNAEQRLGVSCCR